MVKHWRWLCDAPDAASGPGCNRRNLEFCSLAENPEGECLTIRP